MVLPLPYMEQLFYGPTYMYAPHVKCLHVLYDFHGLPFLAWNMYHMVPHMYVYSPLTYMEQVSYSPPTCEVSSCLI